MTPLHKIQEAIRGVDLADDTSVQFAAEDILQLLNAGLWSDEPPKGEMFIWARPNGPGKWSTGLGYWNVSGGWSDAYGGAVAQGATRFHPMPSPPKD